jgi:hypothetical protein
MTQGKNDGVGFIEKVFNHNSDCNKGKLKMTSGLGPAETSTRGLREDGWEKPP